MGRMHEIRRSARRYALGDFPGQAIHPTATDWVARVVSNGGATVSNATLVAVSAFCYTLDSKSLTSLIIALNIYAPDSLIACTTPLIKNAGNDPWTNHNFVGGDLTVNGLLGNGSTKYMDTGCNPNSIFADDTKGGLSFYCSAGAGSASSIVAGVAVSGFSSTFSLLHEQSGISYFESWNVTGTAQQGFVSFASSGFLGFLLGTRASASTGGIYKANAANAFAAQQSFTGSQGTRPNGNIFVHAGNVIGTGPVNFSAFRHSFGCIDKGFSSAQGQNLFNAVDTLRRAFGGGFI